MDDSQYYKDPSLQIMDLMKATFGAYYNYYLGGPTVDFPKAAYPVCVVQPIQSSNTTNGAATGQDRVRELIKIIFLEESNDTADASEDKDMTMRLLYNKIQGRDPASGLYSPGTAMFALRTNLTLNSGSTSFQTTLDHDIQIDYDIIPRQDRPTVLEALLTIVTDERITVQNRY